jgi:hypothetical protein
MTQHDLYPIPGYDDYFAHPNGDIWSMKYGTLRKLKQTISSNGYPSVRLCHTKDKHSYCAHRLILMTFVGPPGVGQECMHLDGCKTNNSLSNLRWGSHMENELHKVAHGTLTTGDRNGARKHPDRIPRGERNGHAKLTADVVRAIRAMYADKSKSQQELAKMFGVHQSLVSYIVSKQRWKHVA